MLHHVWFSWAPAISRALFQRSLQQRGNVLESRLMCMQRWGMGVRMESAAVFCLERERCLGFSSAACGMPSTRIHRPALSPLSLTSATTSCTALQHHQAKIAMTMLPIESIRAVKRWQYAIVKRMLFPTHELSFVDAIARANEVHDLTIDLAQRRGVMLIPTRSEWYGFDPIHIRARHWPSAWGAMIGRCCDRPNAGELQTSFNNWWRLRTHMFDRYWLLGRERRVEQPLQVSGGTAVSFF
jgi:hypothetical protein